MPTEERRLVEEEGSLSKKTWLRKKEDATLLGELQLRAPAVSQCQGWWAPAPGPALAPGPHHTVTTATVSSPLLLALRSPDGRGWVMLGSPNIAARVSRPTLHLTLPLAGCGRRLVEEEGSSSKKTWLRKTVGCGGRRAPAPGPAATFWWRLSPGHPSPEVVTMSSPPAAMGVRAQHSHCRARDSKLIGLAWELEMSQSRVGVPPSSWRTLPSSEPELSSQRRSADGL